MLDYYVNTEVDGTQFLFNKKCSRIGANIDIMSRLMKGVRNSYLETSRLVSKAVDLASP